MTEVCSVNYVDHVGIAVNDIFAALEFFATNFGAATPDVVDMADQGVKACLIDVGETRLELLQPLSAESAVGRFIERRGEGLHHLALNVDDIAGKLKILSANGLSLIDNGTAARIIRRHRLRASPFGFRRVNRAGGELAT